LFQQAAAALKGEPIPPDPTNDEQRETMLWHYDLVCQRFGEKEGTVLMRKYACNYAAGKAGARFFRANVNQVATRAEFLQVVEEFFPR